MSRRCAPSPRTRHQRLPCLIPPAGFVQATRLRAASPRALLATQRSGPPAFDDVLVAARSAGGSDCHWHPGPGPNRRPPGTWVRTPSQVPGPNRPGQPRELECAAQPEVHCSGLAGAGEVASALNFKFKLPRQSHMHHDSDHCRCTWHWQRLPVCGGPFVANFRTSNHVTIALVRRDSELGQVGYVLASGDSESCTEACSS
jgi:hypothetical protein